MRVTFLFLELRLQLKKSEKFPTTSMYHPNFGEISYHKKSWGHDVFMLSKRV